jgi:hypothetical protein
MSAGIVHPGTNKRRIRTLLVVTRLDVVELDPLW